MLLDMGAVLTSISSSRRVTDETPQEYNTFCVWRTLSKTLEASNSIVYSLQPCTSSKCNKAISYCVHCPVVSSLLNTGELLIRIIN